MRGLGVVLGTVFLIFGLVLLFGSLTLGGVAHSNDTQSTSIGVMAGMACCALGLWWIFGKSSQQKTAEKTPDSLQAVDRADGGSKSSDPVD
ncbi:MAG: hypothetical protein ACR2IE_16560 [Candidatus Sumerlaeaceae bacterium]